MKRVLILSLVLLCSVASATEVILRYAQGTTPPNQIDYESDGKPSVMSATRFAANMAWFPFSYDYTTNAYDLSTSVLPMSATDINTSPTHTNAAGGAEDFDGVDDFYTLGNVPYLDGVGDVTIMAWVYHESTNTDSGIAEQIGSGVEGILFWHDTSAGARQDTYSIRVENTAGSANETIYGANGAAPQGAWTHVAVSIDLGSATGLKLYIDGIEDANSPRDLSPIANKSSGGASCFIGGTGTSSQMDGLIDDWRIYTSVLSASAILSIKNITTPSHAGTP